MTPIFSFLIANYNTRPFAKEMLESLKEQTFQSWEAVIVDDASTDGGIDDIIAGMKDERIKLIQLSKNMGASHARNFGFKYCRGQYIVIVDSDDILMPEYLREIYSAFKQNKNINVAYVDLEYFGIQNLISEKPQKDAETMTLEQWIPHGGAALTRETMEKSGGYYEGEELRHGNLDWDFFLSIAQNTPLNVAHISRPLYRYRQYSSNMTKSRAPYEYITRQCMYTRHKEFFDKFGHSSKFLSIGYFESAAAYWAKGEYGEAIRLAIKGTELEPSLRPTLPTFTTDIRLLARLIATNETNLHTLGSKAFEPSEENFKLRQELVLSYIALKDWDKAKKHICILLGMSIGNGLQNLSAIFASQLSLIYEQQNKKYEAAEAMKLAFMCNPFNQEALALNLNKAVDEGKANLALTYLKVWTQVKNFDILKNAMPIFGTLGKIPLVNYDKIQRRLQETAQKDAVTAEIPFQEKIYSSALGRRLIWEYRAKGLFDTYENNTEGQDALRKAVKLVRAKNVLEIGCGNGRNLAMLSDMGLKCVGQDISSTALELAMQRNLPNITLYCQRLDELNFDENYFDLIISNRVLQHLAPDEIDHMLGIISKIGKFIYINESLPSDAHLESWYMKKYDLPRKLSEYNFRLIEKFENNPISNPMLFEKDVREKK